MNNIFGLKLKDEVPNFIPISWENNTNKENIPILG